MIPLYETYRIGKSKKQISGGLGLGAGEWGVTANRYGVSFGGNDKVPELDDGDGCTTL